MAISFCERAPSVAQDLGQGQLPPVRQEITGFNTDLAKSLTSREFDHPLLEGQDQTQSLEVRLTEQAVGQSLHGETHVRVDGARRRLERPTGLILTPFSVVHLDYFREEFVLVLELPVHRTRRNPRPLGHLGQGGAVVSAVPRRFSESDLQNPSSDSIPCLCRRSPMRSLFLAMGPI